MQSSSASWRALLGSIIEPSQYRLRARHMAHGTRTTTITAARSDLHDRTARAVPCGGARRLRVPSVCPPALAGPLACAVRRGAMDRPSRIVPYRLSYGIRSVRLYDPFPRPPTYASISDSVRRISIGGAIVALSTAPSCPVRIVYYYRMAHI
jgi:hypothetical protein